MTTIKIKKSGGGWNKKIWYHSIPFTIEDGIMSIPEDWDSVPGKYEPSHIFVLFELSDIHESSLMAKWIDDNISGYFTYRDWTKGSNPFINDGETYWAGYTFQKLEDAKLVVNEFGGNGNWMEGHDEYVKLCDKNRNNI